MVHVLRTAGTIITLPREYHLCLCSAGRTLWYAIGRWWPIFKYCVCYSSIFVELRQKIWRPLFRSTCVGGLTNPDFDLWGKQCGWLFFEISWKLQCVGFMYSAVFNDSHVVENNTFVLCRNFFWITVLFLELLPWYFPPFWERYPCRYLKVLVQ